MIECSFVNICDKNNNNTNLTQNVCSKAQIPAGMKLMSLLASACVANTRFPRTSMATLSSGCDLSRRCCWITGMFS
ncbi:unnamed protein product [Haemonchus placei]|uniref:Uncharacterized protein n=1 Tax=Haemonchus placei TaxID=6290 RepID=A0A0N4W6M5_HAEPC|nr:unnamed protein product [Haemonchus placei]